MTDEITRAVRSVLGEMTSPETARRLAEALRPIHGREAALFAHVEVKRRVWAQLLYRNQACTPALQERHAAYSAQQVERSIRQAFGVTDNG